MDERITKFRLRDISPFTFANETCEAIIGAADAVIADLHPHARVTTFSTHKLSATLLWQRVFAWVEYAQTGYMEDPALLETPPTAWDDRMVGVIRAAEARKAIDAGECVSTAQLALLAGISHIQVGNFVRSKRLKIDSRDSSGYLFAPSAAAEFLTDRGVQGFARRPRRLAAT